MFTRTNLLLPVILFLVTFLPAGDACAQSAISSRPFSANVIIPQTRSFAFHRNLAAQITGIKVRVTILEQAATTVMDINLRNPGNRRLEAELIVPVPAGAVVKGFAFQGAAAEPNARLLPKEEAKKTYDAIVAKLRDPALMEFVGYNLIRSSVFPIQPRGTQKVRLTYEQVLKADGPRVDYIIPRSESLEYNIPWDISVQIKSKKEISTAYSPTHLLQITRAGKNALTASVMPDARREPGPFRLSYLYAGEGVSASLFAYPDPKVGGGYFLLLAGLPAKLPEGASAIKREVTLVIDRSGSMRGDKIEQVREAAMQIVHGLQKGEAFNIITYNDGVDVFSKAPVMKTDESIKRAEEFIKNIMPMGGTNIYDALLEALRQKPVEKMLPVVLFLTDGLPTVGRTSEVEIRNLAIKSNPHKRRVFTFGVGVDVNTPLLDKIATETRAMATYVLPKEDVEVKVGQAFKKLAGPVIADTEMDIIGPDGKPLPTRVRDIMPGRLPDVFEGDELVILGQYIGDDPLNFRIGGNYLGNRRTFEFSFSLDSATTRNSFVPRLWASRKIGVLVDAIRQMGGNGHPTIGNPNAPDPKLKELIDEIVKLSIEFGILTEYTAFLSLEGTNLSDATYNKKMSLENFRRRAQRQRWGMGSVNQDTNIKDQREARTENRFNGYYDENMNRVVITSVQQVGDRTFFRRGDRWVDSRLVKEEEEITPDEEIEFGSEEHRELVKKLADEGRQGSASMKGDILLEVDRKKVLIRK